MRRSPRRPPAVEPDIPLPSDLPQVAAADRPAARPHLSGVDAPQQPRSPPPAKCWRPGPAVFPLIAVGKVAEAVMGKGSSKGINK